LPCKTEERKKEKVTYLLFVGGITEKEEKYTLKDVGVYSGELKKRRYY
jgi:hypothetical protein